MDTVHPNMFTSKRSTVKRWGLLLMVPLIAGTIVLCVLSWQWRESLKLQRIIVEGSHIITAQQIFVMANIPTKSSIFDVDMYTARKRVLAQPFIESASFHRQYPGVLRIRVTERIPIALVNNGQMRYVDNSGVLLPYVPSQVKLDVPMINGISAAKKNQSGEPTINTEIHTAIDVLRTAQAIDSTMYHFISEIHMNGGKDIILYSTDVAVPIYLGRGDFGKKLLTLQSFWNRFIKTNDAEQVRYIDLRYEDQVVVRWRNDSGSQSKATL